MMGRKKNKPTDISSDDGISDELKIQLIKRMYKVDPEDGFIACLIPTLNREIENSNRNKKLYFLSEEVILFFTGLSGLASALGTNKLFGETVSTVLVLGASITSFASTFLIGLRGIRKWQETWLRHRQFLNLCNVEIRKYADGVSPYERYKKDSSKTEQENSEQESLHEMQKLQDLKEFVYNLIEQNNMKFLNNMEQKK